MNKVELLGRLTKDPEVRYSEKTNTNVVNFTLAVNRRFVKEGEERQADFISNVAFGKTADFIEKYIKKGMQIAVVGRIQTRTYDDNNGQKRYITEVVVEEVYFAESSNKQNSADINVLTASTPVQASTDNNEEFFGDDDFPFWEKRLQYENLIFITKDILRLIHAIKHETIVKYINKYNYSEKEIEEINKLWEIAQLSPITVINLPNP